MGWLAECSVQLITGNSVPETRIQHLADEEDIRAER